MPYDEAGSVAEFSFSSLHVNLRIVVRFHVSLAYKEQAVNTNSLYCKMQDVLDFLKRIFLMNFQGKLNRGNSIFAFLFCFVSVVLIL